MGSVPEQEKHERCASCGKPRIARPSSDLATVPLCEDCAYRMGAFLSDEEEALPQPEERFKELFKAAKALLGIDVVDEDVVYPTLVLANEIWHDLDLAASRKRLIETRNDAAAWREEAARFTLEYRDFKPVRVVEDVLFLELKPVIAMLRNYQNTDVPKEAEIRVHRRSKPASSEQVAAAYEEALSDAGIPCDGSDSISLDCEFREGFLWMCVKNGCAVPEGHAPTAWQGRKLHFPHPRLVGALYDALYGKPTGGKDGFARYLKTRITGPQPEAHNFIPACAASFLRTYGGLKWRTVFDQLSENLLRDWHPQGMVPDEKDEPQSYHSRTTQLENDVKAVEQELLRVAHVLYYPAE
jgi:hypothetical protein